MNAVDNHTISARYPKQSADSAWWPAISSSQAGAMPAIIQLITRRCTG